MSRIALIPEQKEQYMIDDLPYFFEKEAKKRGFCQNDLALALGITPQALSQRKRKQENGKLKDTFKYGDILKIFRLFDLSKDERMYMLSRIFIL